MEKRMNIKHAIIAAAVLGFAVAHVAQGASLQIISAKVGDDRAISIKWESESNAVYRIDYASDLVNSNTQWQLLYEDYPSHGTNSFWMDNGDYAQEPPIKRPKDSPKRFYRIAKTGTNTAAKPFVSVTYPASNAVVSGELIVSVIATSGLPVLDHKLFVDGQEMQSSEDGTNYVINTCEWANGPHTIFATAKAASEMGGVPGSRNITYGRAVSAYIPVMFSNYVSQIYFSEPFFEPSLGQTQRVTAVFDAYSDWTLEILNESETAVRTVTGSGYTMEYAWDGTGDGGSGIPDGVYEYRISATETTAPAPGGGGGGGGSPPSPMMAAMSTGQTSYFVQPPPMPPEYEKLFGPLAPIEVQIPEKTLEGFLESLTFSGRSTVMLAGGNLLAAAATSPKAPKRPPVKPAKGVVSTFGIAYWTFAGGRTNQVPPNGIGGSVTLDGNITGSVIFDPVLDFATSAQGFSKAMTSKAWKMRFHKSDNNLSKNELIRNDLIGYSGSNLFNQVNLGLFMSHGNFGSTLDFSAAAGQSKQTYFPAGGNNPANTWIRLSDFRFGDNLRWMAILACNSLQEDAYQTMFNKMVLPIGDQNQVWNNQLHLLLGCRTYAAVSAQMGERWAKKMNGGAFSSPQTVMDAWFNTGIDTYKGQPATGIYTNTLYFKVVGWDTTFSDRLLSYTDPDPTIDTLEDRNQQVYP
jgi:hypothetical protein